MNKVKLSCGGLPGCETSRLPDFLENQLTDGGEVTSLTRQPRLTFQEKFWYSFLSEVKSTLGPQCSWEDWINENKVMTSSEIEPATFGLVEELLNQLRYRVPQYFIWEHNKKKLRISLDKTVVFYM
jgi:hypothetical protein